MNTDTERLRAEANALRAKGLTPNPWADPTWHGKLFRAKLEFKSWFSPRSWLDWLFMQFLERGPVYKLFRVVDTAIYLLVLYVLFHFIVKYW